MSIEAMKQALEALEWSWGGEPMGTLEQEAMKALRQTIEEAEKRGQDIGGHMFDAARVAAQREWVGLTKEEVNSWELPHRPTVFEFAQFVEAKLKEKNT